EHDGPGGARPGRAGVRRARIPHRHPAYRQVPRDHGRRRADHDVRAVVPSGYPVPRPCQGGAGALSRRVSLPGASELFGGAAPKQTRPETRTTTEGPSTVRARTTVVDDRKSSGRIRHDTKIT